MIFETVYVDFWANRFVVGIQAKPAFYALFQSLEQNDDSKVVIFDPNDLKVEGQNVTALSDDQGGEISGLWRRGRVKLPVQNHQIKLVKLHILACLIRYQRGNTSTVVARQASIVKSVKQVVRKGNNPPA
jgi:hypothetical protein